MARTYKVFKSALQCCLYIACFLIDMIELVVTMLVVYHT